MHTFLLLLLGLCVSVDGQMLFRVLRERINGNTERTQNLIDLSDAPIGLILEGVPFIDSQSTWQIPLGNGTGGLVFESPQFSLEPNPGISPTYLISAIEIRNLIVEGSCDLGATQLGRITSLEVEIGSMGVLSTVNSSCYLDDGFLSLERMGLTALNTVMRFRFPAIGGDEVLFYIEETSPMFEEGQEVNVCLQVEFLAMDPNPQGNPPPLRPLLQYNMNAPTFMTLTAELYDDVTYNGARRVLYTGGIGKLLDGVIGTDPLLFPDEWVGFQEPDSAGLRIFFDREYPVSEIRVYFWNDLLYGVVTPTGGVRNRDGNRIMQFSFSTQSVDSSIANLNAYTGVINPPIMMDYLELVLRTTDQALLITEVSVLQDLGAGELEDIATGFSQKSFSPEIGTATTSSPSETSSDTSPAPSPRSPMPTSASLVLTIVYASVGIVSCLSLVIVSMCMVFLVIFFCMRRGARKQRSISPVPKHASLMRQLSDKYLGTGDKLSYNQFAETGTDLYTEMDNIYQQVDRPLPLPPVPGEVTAPRGTMGKEDSYMEMQQTGQSGSGIGLRIDTGERPPLKALRTLSEDDYAPVTPPSVPVGVKEPPMRLISDLYVAVTPPHDTKSQELKLSHQTIEEQYEAVTPPEPGNIALAMLGMSSIPNQYVSMATGDSNRDV